MEPTTEANRRCAATGCRVDHQPHALFCAHHEHMLPGTIVKMVTTNPESTTWRSRAIDFIAEAESDMAAPRNGKTPLWAITVRQPWASLIAAGEKNVENRGWHPPASLLGQWFAIHASKSFDPEAWSAGIAAANAARVSLPWVQKATKSLESARGMTERAGKQAVKQCLSAAVPYGAIVALARITRIVEPADVTAETSAWFLGPIGWVLEGVTPIEPEPCAGQQGLWAVTGEPLANVRTKFRRAMESLSER